MPISVDLWRSLQDRLYQLTASLEDVDQDLAGLTSTSAYREAFQHLYAAANQLRDAEIEPSR